MQVQPNVVRKPTRSWHAWISSVGLVYVVLLTLRVELVRALSRGGPDLESLVFYGPFTALSLVATVFILRGKRWSYRLGLIVSAVFLFFQILFFLFSGGGLRPEEPGLLSDRDRAHPRPNPGSVSYSSWSS